VIYGCVLLAALAAAVFGFIAWGASGVCENSCPSDLAVTLFKVMFFGGVGLFVGLVIWPIVRRTRRR
jgi:predicted PurR-regulated permease PerM